MLPPAAIVCVEGVTETAKSVTLNVTVAACAAVPFVPVIVSVEFAAGVVPLVVIVNVDVPVLPMIAAGLKLAVAPVGRPETARATSPVSPLTAVLVNV